MSLSRLTMTFVLVGALLLFAASANAQTTVFINEIHYDNAGSDTGEAIEIAGPAGSDLSGWSLVLYNGNGGAPYNTIGLSTTIPDLGNGIGVVAVNLPSNGLQNGSPDGIALVDDTTVVQFLSYEGSFTAVGGPADGMTSEDIGVAESSSTPVGDSLQLTGTGGSYEDFTWSGPVANTFDAANVGQTFEGGAPPFDPSTVFINEFHYDNAGSDVGEAIEVAAPAGTDLTDFSLVLYNGNGGAPYNTIALGGTVGDLGAGFGVAVVSLPSNGLQNGSPDGIALVYETSVVQFLSYEGSFTAVGGPANGMTSTDIGVAESSGTPIGFSLQLTGTGRAYADFTWAEAAADTFGAENNGQVFGDPVDPPANVFVNEIHYDNAGSDTGEAIEIAASAGTNLDGFSLVLYNGNGGGVYNTTPLAGVIDDQCQGFGFLHVPIAGIQNGAPDGVALVNASGEVLEFLSYEGAFTAVDGPAVGLLSEDIGVAESSSTAVGESLQLSGDGTDAAAFTWVAPAASTFGAANNGQTFGDPAGGCGDPEPPMVTPIPVIQGSGDSSPIVGSTVTVEAVVTGDFQDGVGTHGDLNGFYLQDAAGDGDPATSDGIFVFDGSNPDVDVNVGDLVRVTGTVTEFFGETQISAPGAGAVENLGPAPMSVAPTDIAFPAAGTRTNSRGEVIADLEAVEGMLVRVPGTLTVSELFQLDRFGEMLLAQGGRFTQFTQTNIPDPSGFQLHIENVARRSLIIDDGLTVQNPDPIRYPAPGLTTANAVRMGDTITGLTGNIRYSRGSGGSGDEAYRLEPVVEPLIVAGNARPTGIDDGDGRLRIASFNVLNFFNDLDDGTGSCLPGGTSRDCRGADSVEEFERQAAKLVTALAALDADVIGLNEIENDYPSLEDSAIAELVDRLNIDGTSSCGSRYDYVRSPGNDSLGTDAIAVGIIYCASSVTPAMDSTVAALTDEVAATLGFTPPIFNGPATSRVPLAATFDENISGERFTVAVNHFKSKGSSGLGCGDPASDPNCDQGDGAGFWNERRTESARALIAWLATDPTESGDADVIVLGDLNAYRLESPVTTFDNAGFVNLVESGDYSFVFDAQTGTLDYAIVSPTLASGITGVDEWHINADESDGLDYNLDFGRNPSLFDPTVPVRASDHDPLAFGLDLPDTVAPTIACNVGEPLFPGRFFTTYRATAYDALDPDPAVGVGQPRCERETGNGTKPSFCIAFSYRDKVLIVLPGPVGNRISWPATATDASGNASQATCSVDVVPPRGRGRRR